MHSITVMIKPVSSACNMRCRYCFYADVASRREHASMGKMSDETLENLVRKALRYADTSATFAFQGGELLSHLQAQRSNQNHAPNLPARRPLLQAHWRL